MFGLLVPWNHSAVRGIAVIGAARVLNVGTFRRCYSELALMHVAVSEGFHNHESYRVPSLCCVDGGLATRRRDEAGCQRRRGRRLFEMIRKTLVRNEAGSELGLAEQAKERSPFFVLSVAMRQSCGW